MERVLIVVIALGLSACGSTDFYGDSANDSPPIAEGAASAQTAASESASLQSTSATSPAPFAEATTSSKAHCKALSKQRAMDAAFQGEDSDTQESVYNRTYSDCIAWDLKHKL